MRANLPQQIEGGIACRFRARLWPRIPGIRGSRTMHRRVIAEAILTAAHDGVKRALE